jgi:surfactin synthase thioesterase subunit
LGHSLGGLVGFELARLWSPLRLIVAARKAPHLPPTGAPLSGLDDTAFIDGVGRRYGAIPKAVLDDPELLALTLPALRADLELYESYAFSAAAPIAAPIDVFGGSADATASAHELEAWAEHTSAGAQVTMCEGGHFFLTPPPAALIATLRAL